MAPLLLPSFVALLVGVSPPPLPAPDASTQEAPWVVNRVSADGQTLVLWARRGGCDPEPSATVIETPVSVEIHVRHATPASDGPCPAMREISPAAVQWPAS